MTRHPKNMHGGMNRWYDNIVLHPKTHEVLFGYKGEFPHEQRNELLKDCVCCETNDIICYAYCDVIWQFTRVFVVNKHDTTKDFVWVCGQSLPKFKIIDNVIYAKASSSSYIVKIYLKNTGSIFVESLHVNNWNQIKILNNV